MVIDCDACAARGPACGDCVVSVLLGGPPARGHEHPARSPGGERGGPPGRVELDGAEQAALAVLAGCGLVPPLRLVPRAEPAPPDHPTAGEADREVS